MDTRGENAREITTEDLGYLTSLAWFPDGQRLALTTQNGIEIIDVISGARTLAIDDFATKDIDVSADGKAIVYGINGQTSLRIVVGF